MLTREQVEFYNEHGYLRIPNVFSSDEVAAMREELDWMIADWADKGIGWTGPWRKQYMNDENAEKAFLIAMHDLQFYGESWNRCVSNPRLVQCMADILGPNVELHHSTMHVKPPETGHLFPMHQDWAFYKHEDGRYVDVLVHLDDTCHENGEIRFIDGSHKLGALEHVTMTDEGPCTPHLPFEDYSLDDTVPVPAKAGDVVIFNIFTIHGSYLNTTPDMRRMVRVGYRDPANKQLGGQSLNRPGLMVAGRRARQGKQALYTTDSAGVPADEAFALALK